MAGDKTQGSGDNLVKSIVGQNYEYAKWIKTPNEMGMSGEPNALSNNIGGIMNYVHLLTEGGGPASKNNGRPLGDRYFMHMGGKCSSSGGSQVARSLYINNVADGNIPFLNKMGINVSSFKGLIPGMLGDIGKLDPASLFAAFSQPSSPECSNIYMKTIDANNKNGTGSGFVLNSDIKGIAPCAFVDGVNPISKKVCTESFISAMMGANKVNRKEISFKNKPIANIYTALVSGLLLYITYKFIYKND